MADLGLVRHARFRLPPDAAPLPLRELLAGRFTYRDAAGWHAELLAQRLHLNGIPAAPDAVVAPGDWLDYFPDAARLSAEPAVDFAWRVVWEDDCLLAVDKPGNLPCHPAGCFFQNTLWASLRQRFGDAFFALANRLDRETSGLVLVAKSQAVARALNRLFSARQVDKSYLVLVEGAFPATLEATGWLSRDPASEVRKKRRFQPAAAGSPPPEAGAEWAESSFQCRQTTAAGLSLVEARPRTGRLHQLRATLHSLGYPVVGDKLYGVDDTLFLRFCADTLSAADQRRLRLPRQALHAAQLAFRHPVNGAELLLRAPLPPALAALLAP